MNILTTPFLSQRELIVETDPLRLVVNPAWGPEVIARARSGLSEVVRYHVVLAGGWIPGEGALPAPGTDSLKMPADRRPVTQVSTCYQLLDFLELSAPHGAPLLILDFLRNFYDPAVPLPVRTCVLEQSIRHLIRISRERVVTLLVRPLALIDFHRFSPLVFRAAGEVVELQAGIEAVILPVPIHG